MLLLCSMSMAAQHTFISDKVEICNLNHSGYYNCNVVRKPSKTVISKGFTIIEQTSRDGSYALYIDSLNKPSEDVVEFNCTDQAGNLVIVVLSFKKETIEYFFKGPGDKAYSYEYNIVSYY